MSLRDDVTLTKEDIKVLKDLANREMTGNPVAANSTLQNLADPNITKLIQEISAASGSLTELVRLMDAYQKSGTMQKVFELVTLLGIVRDALSTEVVAHIAENVNTLMVTGDQLITELGGVAEISSAIKSAKKASKEVAQDSGDIGVFGLFKALKEPSIQKGIKFLIHFARNINK